MKVRRMGLKGVLIAAWVFFVSPSAMAFVIDGLVTDWGIDLSAATAKGYLDTHTPSGVFSVTEDNADTTASWWHVLPGWSDGNYFDAEALYFTNDATHAYVALIQGLPFEGHTAPGNPHFDPGDIAFDIGQDGHYDFGIDTSSFDLANTRALLYATPFAASWNPAQLFTAANPWTIDVNNSNSLGFIDFAYSGPENSHYVLEARIPLQALGLSDGDSVSIHWAQQCGNDYLTLSARSTVPIPEPASMVLVAQGLLALGIAGLRKSRKS